MKKISGGRRLLGTKEQMWDRHNASVTNQCVACGRQAKRVYATFPHSKAVVCTEKCHDHFLEICG
jgi:hypothetical protein